MDPKAGRRFLLFHLLCLIGAALFPLYVLLTEKIMALLPFPSCLLHDRLFLYCPLCGGTRAVSALLRLDPVEAVASNAYVVLMVAVAAVLYGLAWVRLLRGKARLVSVPSWLWISSAVLLVVFGVMRNVAMIVWQDDPLGDLIVFWNQIQKVCAY